jgi:hypothetical protein
VRASSVRVPGKTGSPRLDMGALKTLSEGKGVHAS